MRVRRINTGYCHSCRLKILPPELGKKRPDMIGNKFKKPLYGKDNLEWKGEKAGYVPKHLWIQRQKGKPTKCEHCGKDGLTGRKIHWANIDHKYRRILSDWIRLCAKCHKKYDKS